MMSTTPLAATPALERPAEVPQPAHRFVWPALALVVTLTCLFRLPSGFWLDETATFWIVKDSAADAITRALYWSGQSPLFYLVVWAWSQIAGYSEIALRIPAAVFGALTAVLLYRLGLRLMDHFSAACAVLMLFTVQEAVFVMVDARPYTMGLLAVVAAVTAFVKWLETGRTRYAAAYVLLATLTVYVHYLMGVMFAVHAAYAILQLHRGESRAPLRHLIFAWAGCGLLMTPLVPQLLAFYSTRRAHSFAAPPSFLDLTNGLIPPALILGGFAGLLLAACHVRLQMTLEIQRRYLRLLLLWAAVPVLSMFAASFLFGVGLFVPRYYLAAAPGLALLAGAAIGALAPAPARLAVLTAVALTAALTYASFRQPHDWRSAMAKVRELTAGSRVPVLVCSGFIEARDPENLNDPKLRDVLFAPLLMYPAAGEVHYLPPLLTTGTARLLRDLAHDRLAYVDKFVLVSTFAGPEFEAWLLGAIPGVSARSAGTYGSNLNITVFSKAGADEIRD